MTAAANLTIVKPKRGVGGRIVEFLGRGVINVVLAIVAIFWLVPTVGLFFASLRDSTDNSQSGWWTALTAPAQLTLGCS